MYDLRDKMLVLDEADVLKQGESAFYMVWVPAGRAQFRATMVYADVEGTANSTVNRVNDLDLKVTDPNGKVYWGNYGLGGAANPSLAQNYSSLGTQTRPAIRDRRDTVENVFVRTPVAGVWVVEVFATLVSKDTHTETSATDADFALVVSGIGAGRDRSGMTLDFKNPSTGNLSVELKNIPSNFTEGWTLFSFATGRPAGFGNFGGLVADATTLFLLSSPVAPGLVFHFNNNKAKIYPNAPFSFSSGLATSLKGATMDAVALVIGPGGFLGVSNVARVKVK